MAEEHREVGDEQPRGPSDTDAMGLDKRRQVVGGQYGASVRKQATIYGVALLVTILIVVVFLTVVRGYDNRDIALEETAPWTNAESLAEPRPIDFPRNGPENTIPRDEIGAAPAPEASDRQSGG